MEEVTLPELPKPFHTFAMPWIGRGEPGPRKPFDYYTPDQLREYARVAVRMERERAGRGALDVSVTELLLRQPQPTIADAIRDAVLAERERCAQIAEDMDFSPHGAIAAAIRGDNNG